MLIIIDKFEKGMIDVFERLITQGKNIEVITEGDITVKRVGKSVQLYTKGNTLLNPIKVFTIGRINKYLLELLEESSLVGVNDLKLTNQLYTQFDAIKTISRIFPQGFTKEIRYNRGNFSFEFIPSSHEVRNITPKVGYDSKSDWIVNKLESEGLKYYKLTIAERKELFYPLAIIPYLTWNDLGEEDWYEILKSEIDKEI